jgi:hypothetical protein
MNPHTFTSLRDTLEVLYFASGVVVAAAAIVALYQLILTKRTSQLTAKRDAYALSGQQCQYYLTQIIPLLDALDRKMNEVGINSLGSAEINVSGRSVSFSLKPKKLDDKIRAEVSPPLLAVYNALEAFSIPFTNGVAEESIAFSAIGQTFCHSVKKFVPELVPLSQFGYFQNTVNLFTLWYPRLKKRELEQRKLLLEKKCEEITDVTIKAIGT